MSAFVVLSLASSVPCQVIGWEERLRNDLLVLSGMQNLNQSGLVDGYRRDQWHPLHALVVGRTEALCARMSFCL